MPLPFHAVILLPLAASADEVAGSYGPGDVGRIACTAETNQTWRIAFEVRQPDGNVDMFTASVWNETAGTARALQWSREGVRVQEHPVLVRSAGSSALLADRSLDDDLPGLCIGSAEAATLCGPLLGQWPTPDPALQAYVYVAADAPSQLWRVEVRTGTGVRIADTGGVTGHPSFSPDGTQIAVEVDGRLAVFAADGSGEITGSRPACTRPVHQGDAVWCYSEAGHPGTFDLVAVDPRTAATTTLVAAVARPLDARSARAGDRFAVVPLDPAHPGRITLVGKDGSTLVTHDTGGSDVGDVALCSLSGHDVLAWAARASATAPRRPYVWELARP